MDSSADTLPRDPLALPTTAGLRASMLRPRTRLPAGPRTRPQPQTPVHQPPLQDVEPHQHLVSDPVFDSTSLPTPPESDPPDDASGSAPALSLVASVSDPLVQSPEPLDTASVPMPTDHHSPIDPIISPPPTNSPRKDHPISLPIVSLSASPDQSSTSSASIATPLIPQNPPSRPATPQTSPMSAVKPIPRAPTLSPLPPITFVPEPLPYKHLTLDAAHWTLTSSELQSLVSTAIRESAKEKYIQLLPPAVLNGRLHEDTDRVEKEADGAASRWRFDVARRNMLVRGLASAAGDAETVHALLGQLVSTLAAMDGHTQTLLHTSAHRTQLSHARDTHRASALAVALRKLNASYARRTKDLEKARVRMSSLEGEVEEAWKMAEDVAGEVDRLKGVVDAMEKEMEAGEQRRKARLGDRLQMVVNGVGGEDGGGSSSDDEALRGWDAASMNDHTSISRAEVVGVTGKAVFTKARLTNAPATSPTSPTAPPSSFSMIEASTSTAAKRMSTSSQVSRVSAARTRSMRTSKASLRIPHAHSSSNFRGESPAGASTSDRRSVKSAKSKSSRKKGSAKLPVPSVPVDDLAAKADDAGASSFLEMEGRTTGDEDADGEAEVGGKAERDDSDVEQPLASGSTLSYNSPTASNMHRFTYPPKLHPKRPRSPTTPNLLSSYLQPSKSTSSSSSAAPGPTSMRPVSTSSAATSLSASIPPSASMSTLLGAPGHGQRPPKPHDISTASFPELDTLSDSQSRDTGHARRGRSLELPVHGAGRLRRNMSELLRFGGKTRRKSEPVGFALGAKTKEEDMEEDSRL